MTIATLFEKYDETVQRCFEDIPTQDRMHPSDAVLCGLLKVKSLAKRPEKRVIQGADHDVIWLLGESHLVPLSDEDVIYLLRCGVWWSEESECLARFV